MVLLLSSWRNWITKFWLASFGPASLSVPSGMSPSPDFWSGGPILLWYETVCLLGSKIRFEDHVLGGWTWVFVCFRCILKRYKMRSNHEKDLVADRLWTRVPSSRFCRIGAPFLWIANLWFGGGLHFPIKFIINSLKAYITLFFLKWVFVFICDILKQ